MAGRGEPLPFLNNPFQMNITDLAVTCLCLPMSGDGGEKDTKL